MTAAQSTQPRRCPGCRTKLGSAAVRCWRCQRLVAGSHLNNPYAAPKTNSSAPTSVLTGSESSFLGAFIGSVVLAVVLIVLGVSGVVLWVVAGTVVSAVRTWIIWRLGRGSAAASGGTYLIRAFFESLGILALSFVAAACTVILSWWVGMQVLQAAGWTTGVQVYAVAALAGLLVGCGLFWRFWPRQQIP